MHEISLIISTLGERPEDLRSLLGSLAPQADYLCDVIVVDQNPDQRRVPALLGEFREFLPIRCVRSERGLSRARNRGLPLALGKFVAFPDDDCLYPDGLLEWVVSWFASSQAYDILAVGVKDAMGVLSGNRWPQNACDIGPINAFRTTFSSSLFVRRDVAMTEQFDLRLGVGSGTVYGSGEETDYVLRLIGAGARGRFDRTRNIIHPRRDMLSGGGSESRAQSYGFGMGHLLRAHTLGPLWMSFLTYNLGRAGWALSRGDVDGARLCTAQTKGLWRGYMEPVETATAVRAAGSSGLDTIATQSHLRSVNVDRASISN
jgi:glycosyltransferase involved in cell wall biosynthesis